jgi:hypothetical protein
MSRNALDTKLAALEANEAAHNRWKLLAEYPESGTARNSASRLRRRYREPCWEFKSTKLPNGKYGVGVLFKRLNCDGRAPEDTGMP